MTLPKWKILSCQAPEEWALNRKKYAAASAQHQASREALSFLLSEEGIEIKANEIELENFSKVRGADKHVVSLSHTSPHFAAAVLGQTDLFKSVGVDLEKSDRKMKINSGHHFLNEGDDPELHQDLLIGWCKKEAAFKAWAPFWNDQIEGKPFILKDLDIRGDFFFRKESDESLGRVKLLETNHEGQALYLTLAWVLT